MSLDENQFSATAPASKKQIPIIFLTPKHIEEAYGYTRSNGIAISCAPCSSTISAFRENIRAVVETATIPHAMAQEGAILNVLQRTHLAAMFKAKAHAIRNEKKNDEPFVIAYAKEEFDRMCEADRPHHIKSMDDLSELSLMMAADSGTFTKPAEELLRQSSVLLWSSLEVLLRDLFVALCNTHPGFFVEFKSKMQDNEKTRKRFDFKISFDVLEKYGFNGANVLGDIFLEHNQIQGLENLLNAVKMVLACETAEFDKVEMSQVWNLYYRRHLIVHRRGIVDLEHFNRLRQDGSIGEKLEITPETFKSSLNAVVALAQALETHLVSRHAT